MGTSEKDSIDQLKKRYKKKHPFRYKKYNEYVDTVMGTLEKLDEMESVIITEVADALSYENKTMTLLNIMNELTRMISMLKSNSIFRPSLQPDLERYYGDLADSIVAYTRVILRCVMMETNDNLFKYLDSLKERIIEDYEDDFPSDEAIEVFCEAHAEPKEHLLMEFLQTKDEEVSRRVAVRNALAFLRSIAFVDYVEIMMGVDIIHSRKRESKKIDKEMKFIIRYVDLKSMKGADINEFIRPRT